MTEARRGTDAGWPFWAPSDDSSAARALELASIRPGDRVADLGCGDGRVLVAAAARGATVLGVESDEELAAQARERLREAGVDGSVIAGDIFDVDLEVDVAFCYLAPATLQRLVDRLKPGTRLVTVDFEVPGLAADAVDGSASLYELPGRAAPPPGTVGWTTAGTLAVAPPGSESLTCLDLFHPGGPVDVRASKSLRRKVAVATGADHAAPGQLVAVDLVWSPAKAGVVHWGTLKGKGIDRHALVVVREEWEDGGDGTQWDLTDDGAAAIAAYLADHPGKHTLADLLDAANG